MKIFLTLIVSALFLNSCDSPRTSRSIISSNSNSLTPSNSSGINLTPGTGVTGTGTNTGTEGGTTTTNPTAPEDAKHCKFSVDGSTGFESSSTHLGAYTLCQSSVDKTTFYAQFKTPPVTSAGDVSVCFIPHTTSGSNSIYIGNPMCGTFPDPKSVKKITFIKYSQYSSALINSVMFFKDSSFYYPVFNRYMMTLDAYKTCMSMLAYGQSAYCESFKSVGQYVMRTF
ncbi:MAG: hypothetical protein HOP07_16995 [Bacteriovoracaceae bacterium]|nr:hypothetical protein [Bacteriovoracaceae bacterium]